MANVDPQLVRRWIKQQIIFDQATITYRALARQGSCPAEQAREFLERFHESEDGRRLQVKANYLVFGRDEELVGDCCCSMRVERADEDELEEVKAKLSSVSSVQIYSIRATQAPDPNLLKSQRELIQLKPATKPISKTETECAKASKRDSQQPGTPKPSCNKVDSVTARPLSPRPKTTSLARAVSAAAAKPPSSGGTKNKPSSSVSTSSKKEQHASEGRKQGGDKDLVGIKTSGGGGIKSKRTSDKIERVGDEQIEVVGSQDPPPEPPKTRKRVTKTRKVEKKKTIRVKDKKGYRVNREVVEEVLETYTDWEDEEEVEVGEPVRKKSRKNSKKMSAMEEGKEVGVEVKEKVLPGDAKKEAKEVEKIKKKPPASAAAKEQSNITSFFKKG